ncbi:unnamed protein product [Dibothriocephalus latus]|uniref:Uncharacterized protein n=1 Tax=Dibothriocephalus latus TaxID=60516 RepID=A0A3P7LNB2_DIBLA|nr:unnamed protein product [Dibothriocephalus latus]
MCPVIAVCERRSLCLSLSDDPLISNLCPAHQRSIPIGLPSPHPSWLPLHLSRLDGILDYEAKSASGFKEMRSALQDIHDKMAKHRLLIDRYSGLDMKEGNGVVKDRVEAKVEELIPRMPCLTSVQRPHRADGDAILNDFDPRLVPGYSTGLCITKDDRNSELRGRIRSLLCRTRETSKKDANNPHLKSVPARRREVTVE